ncbi:TonB-dependent receptor [Mucilaginibacter agri]|uniref:TonB-dependent receptor n=1 Tax=Mucilaginibacter agri TaxID=2695265 RepID=A0A965ZF21_9SPHI|nr:TonB-dependent receptor [Mucilaginibacter agri]NCD69028.1 hypothetical protein [Mucilaginibacter agri]
MKAIIISILLFLWALLSAHTIYAQTLHGTVKDSLGKVVSFAGVNLKAGGNTIIAYTVSNDRGMYSLAVPADADKKTLILEVSCIGFTKQSKPVTDLNTPYNFALSMTNHQLKTVTVKDNRPRLRTSGDTLNYKVSDFSGPQDRVIGDVIKKLPGIAVDANGKISYNGKSISNFYIGGDNLLDDKYNIATSTIPSAAVDKVQVMENHQPVKMLQNKVLSDDVALNITIKKEAQLQLMGQATIGAGLPGKYDENINAIMLKDKYKAINYLKGNNTGNDVAWDLTSHNMSEYNSRVDNNKPTTELSLGAAGNPNLPTSRYLFNQSGLLNLNNLVNIKKDVQLKANISYLHDTQKQDYQKLTQTYLPGDTITYTEVQKNKKRPDLLHAQFNLNINKEKFYLNDALMGDVNYNTSYSALTTNGNSANQKLKDNLRDFSNELSFMQTLKSGTIVNLYSYIDHITEPEIRTIEPGLNASIFNNSQPYKQLVQTVNVPTWATNNYVLFTLPGDLITQKYKAGFNIQSQQLNSLLYTVQNDQSTRPALDSAANNLDWTRKKFFAEAGFDIPGKKLKLAVTVPVTLQQTSYKEPLYQLDESLTRLYVNPQVSLKYLTGIENYITLSYNYRNNIGDINNVYRGYILTNYRSLYANNAGLTETKTQNAGLGFNYRKAIDMFFFGINTIYSHTDANNIAYSNITPNFQQRIVLPYQNSTDSWMIMGSISKYNFDLHTTFSGGASWQSSRSNQIFNGELLPYQNKITTVNAGIETKVSSTINFSYKINFSHNVSQSSAAPGNAFNQLQHNAAITYVPISSLYFTLSGDNYYTHQPNMNDLNYSFADFNGRYRFTKSKIDIELNALNLLNTKTYSTAYLSANTYTNSVYKIPGRMIVAKVTFNY